MSKQRFWIALCAALLALGVSGVVSAHAVLVRSDPADGAVIAQPPQRVTFWFNEGVVVNFTTIKVLDSAGHETALATIRSENGDPKVLSADLPDLPPGAYRITWSTVSNDDLHTTAGSIVFGVQQAAEIAASPVVTAAPPLTEVGLRWLNFFFLATLAGSISMLIIVWPAGQSDSPYSGIRQSVMRRRLFKLAVWSVGLAMLAGAGLLIIQTQGDPRAALQVVTSSAFGAHWVMRQGWLLVILLILMLHLRGILLSGVSSRTLAAVLLPLLLAVIISQTLTSHTAAASDDAVVPVIIDAFHLLAATIWTGGLVCLAITIVPMLRGEPSEKLLARSILRRFSVLAATCVAILAITGLIDSGQQIASLDALLFTPYGQSMLLKTAAVLSVLLIAAINTMLVHPQIAEVIRRMLHRPIGWTLLPARLLWRTIVLESIGASLIILFAAVLTASAPARGPEFDPPSSDDAEVATPAISTNVADLLVTFSIRPNHPGQNFIELGVFNTRRPPPAPIEQIAVKLTSASAPDKAITFSAPGRADGRYELPTDAIAGTGDWEISVSVTRPDQPTAVLNTSWRVTPPGPSIRPRPVVISAQPLAPWTILFAALIAGGVSAGLIAVGVWRGMRRATLLKFRTIAAVRSASKE